MPADDTIRADDTTPAVATSGSTSPTSPTSPTGRPWPVGSATGVGSLPGTDPLEACRLVLGELSQLPHLPELPARGPFADLTGRSTALLADLPVDLQPSGWRLVPRSSMDSNRAADALQHDLDALQEAVGGSPPPRLKVQCAGPWTLAATVELTRGDRALADPGAVRDLTASLAEGLSLHLADLRRRLPGTELLLQLDEPVLPAVLAAQIPTSSGFGTLRAPDPQRIADHLATVLSVLPGSAVHCCAPRPPVALLRRAGAAQLGLDAALLSRHDDEVIGEAVEQGAGLLLGVVPGTGSTADDLPSVDAALRPVRALWRRLGLAPELLPEVVVLTPSCGLAGATPAYAAASLRRLVEAATALADEPL